MTLFPLHTSKITLPDLIISDKRVGNNKVIRYGFKSKSVKAEIYESGRKGLYSIKTALPTLYDYIYLRQPRRRPILPDNSLCLDFIGNIDVETIDESTRFKWYQHPLIGDQSTPDEICQSWEGQFQFKEDKPNINKPGLRKPQLGALHSISAYFSVDRNLEPATVVLPTGTGKTETMLSALIYRQLKKLLVLVPYDSLRNQISNKFMNLGKLTSLGITPFDIALPKVAIIKKSIKTITEVDDLLKSSNVIIATPNILRHSNQAAICRLCNCCTDLFIDEAHHITAKTWVAVRDQFVKKRVVQFTATPFRNNGEALGGHIIYNYTMGEAQKADYFKHIDLIPVEEYYIGEGDHAIAEEAVSVLKKDLEHGYDHILMARVEKISRADDILSIYKKLAPEFNPIIVHSRLKKALQNEAFNALFSKKSKIVICVKMLGEGFDFPNLKVAAIHDIHKSLAITLQFIGRFTRNSDNVGNASVIVNVAEPDVETGLQKLYAQGADWDGMLRRLSESRIEREIRLQDVVDQLKEKGNLHKQLSLWNLRPSFSAMLFNTTCNTWSPERFKELIPKNTEHWFAIGEKECLLVVLAIHQAPVKWGNYKVLTDSVYKLLIAHWDIDRHGLFIFSNDYKWFRVERMAELLCNDQCSLLSGPRVFNVFNGLQYPLIRNLGASQVGAISFTQYFGPNVTEGLNRIESAKSNLSNLAGLGYDNGEKVIWGCSQKKGKIWSVNSGSISDWTLWVKTAWDKVTSGDVDEENITRDFLRPKRITEPFSEYAIAVQWGEHIQADPEDRVMISFGNKEVPLYLVDLKIISQGDKKPYNIAISCDDLKSVYEFTISESLNGGFGYQLLEGDPVSIKRGSGTEKPIEEYLQSDPWIIQYVDGSFSYNCFLIKLSQAVGEFPQEQIDCWDWSGINIKKESMGKAQDAGTIQWRSFEYIEDQYDVILNDDGSGEAADLVGLKIGDDEIHLALVHCKYSASDHSGARISDLYELCGQAQKSIRWKHAGIGRLYGHLKGRENIWKNEGVSRFLKGSMRDLANIKSRARTAPIKLDVYIVQPGLKKEGVTSNMLRVIGCTAVYLKNTAQAELIVVGSGAENSGQIFARGTYGTSISK